MRVPLLPIGLNGFSGSVLFCHLIVQRSMAKHFSPMWGKMASPFSLPPPRSGACRSSDTRSPRASLFYFKKYVALLIFQIKLQNKPIPKSHPIPCPMQVRGNNCRTRSVAVISDLWWQMLKLLLIIWKLIWFWWHFASNPDQITAFSQIQKSNENLFLIFSDLI